MRWHTHTTYRISTLSLHADANWHREDHLATRSTLFGVQYTFKVPKLFRIQSALLNYIR